MDPAIRIDSLTKDFALGIRGLKLRAVDDLSLTVQNNQIFGLLGPNGSGKSTTIKVILGLVRPTFGECQVFGQPSHIVDARAKVGYLPEAPYFYRFLSGRELVKFYAEVCGVAKDAIDQQTDDVIELVGMKAAASRRVGTYSKGMLQRVGLAQAMVHDPQLVILDEPTAGVDPIGSAAISEIIRELKNQGKTVVLCSHLLAQVEDICDHVAILNKGKLIVEGAVSELLLDTGRQIIEVEGGGMTDPAKLTAALEKAGATVRGVETPRMRLDDLFLQKVREGGDGSGFNIPDRNPDQTAARKGTNDDA